MPQYEKVCANCGDHFVARASRALYCTESCRCDARRMRDHEDRHHAHLWRCYVEATGEDPKHLEMQVMGDYLSKILVQVKADVRTDHRRKNGGKIVPLSAHRPPRP
jgi:hypothetical protein